MLPFEPVYGVPPQGDEPPAVVSESLVVRAPVLSIFPLQRKKEFPQHLCESLMAAL